MGIVNIPDFENVSTGQPRLDGGTYTMKIEIPPVTEFQTSKDGNQVEVCVVKMKVQDGPMQKEAGDNGNSPVGRDWSDYIQLTKKSAWRLKRLLIAAGLLDRNDKTSEMARGNIDTNLLVGCHFQVRIVDGMYEGKPTKNTEYVI